LNDAVLLGSVHNRSVSARVQGATHAVCGTGREGTTPVSYRAVHLRMTIDMVHITELILREPSTGDNDQRFQKKEKFKRGLSTAEARDILHCISRERKL
jgi:hypothetical protein